ncbi:MAG: ISAzo13-like element transposase-related protein, partial [Thermoplasmata archaeon]
YPPGTSKWNKIEHRMFSFISANWQGVPLESYATVVNLIAGTRSRGGLKVSARLDRKVYAKGQKIPDEETETIPLHKHETNPTWNYTIQPE